ncbi:MAG: isoleucine--tRNA ligase [Firmicutes bacterium]|nr:isoleucine--tRNA ligase [Bacillota bacterium]
MSSNFDKFNNSLDFAEKENLVIDFWQKEKIFEKSIEKAENSKPFTFYDGPPTANGKPHIGHVLTRVYKDIIPRFHSMKGKKVLRKAGWDTHGLPVELEVEKSLGLGGKGDIEKYGVEPFIKACKDSVFKYQQEWEKMSSRIGFWVDMKNPYITYDDKYIESVWWSLEKVFNKDLIYKGHKVVPYCPRCGTALSSHEVSQGYKDVSDLTAVVKFKLNSAQLLTNCGTDKPIYFLAWTTTPWTLPSNVALCVNPKAEYSFVEKDGEVFILASELVEKHFGKLTADIDHSNYAIVDKKLGKDLVGTKYEPLFDSQNQHVAYKIISGDFVTLTDGTGIVHIAPAYGEDDYQVAKVNDCGFLQLVGTDGKFDNSIPELAGTFCKDADVPIIKILAGKNLLFSKAQYKHSYPFCWRCNTPLIYFARSTWFIAMSKLKKQLIKNNRTINWMPETIKEGRMGDFLENVIDWGISRERYWGTPLPIWICDSCGEQEAIGSKAELVEKGNIKGDIELHKPYVDNVTFPCSCSGCKGTMRRTSEVIDCWYDSGSMPFAQHNYPHSGSESFNDTFPADFICEAVDQTRGWFYTLIAISTLLFNKAPFKNCIVLGHVLDGKGIKMSKHIGNVVEPMGVIEAHSADAVRWYFYTSSAPWLPSRFSADSVAEGGRKFLSTVWNTCSFYELYRAIDNFDPSKYPLKKCQLSQMDEWILSELNVLIDTVDKNLNLYKITESARAIETFLDDLSNWYIRRCRARYWASGMESDKISAFATLHEIIEKLSKLIAPFTPFIAERLHQHFVRPYFSKSAMSVHLEKFPKADKNRINPELSQKMRVVLNSANLARSARSAANIKIRQPLNKMYLAGCELESDLMAVLADELNVKEVILIKEAGEFIDYSLKPQLKTLGPKYGKLLGVISKHLAENANAVIEATKNGGIYKTVLDGQVVELSKEDLLSSAVPKAGFTSETGFGLAVILDTTLTQELIEEGILREVISKLQNMRKASGFEVTDRIVVEFCNYGSVDIERLITKYTEQLKTAVLANEIVKKDIDWMKGHPEIPNGATFDIGDSTGFLCVSKVN